MLEQRGGARKGFPFGFSCCFCNSKCQVENVLYFEKEEEKKKTRREGGGEKINDEEHIHLRFHFIFNGSRARVSHADT